MDLTKATLAWTLDWDTDWVTAVTFLGPTRKLVAGNNRGELLQWELPEKAGGPAPVPTLRRDGHTNVISRLLSTRDGKQLISSSYDRTIRLWDTTAAPDGKATVPLNERRREYLKRGRASKIPPAVEAPVATSKASKALEGHRDWVTALTMSADEKLLVSGDDANAIVVWDRVAMKELRRWPLKGWTYALALSPDAKQVLVTERVHLIFDSGRHDGLTLWDVGSGKLIRDMGKELKGQHLSAALWTPDGKAVLVGKGGETDKGVVHYLDPVAGKKTKTLTPDHQYGITDLALHPDGKHFASTGRDTTIRIWEIATGKLVATLGKPRGGQFKDWLHAVAFSADGRWLAAGDMAGAVQVWSLG